MARAVQVFEDAGAVSAPAAWKANGRKREARAERESG